MHKRLEQYVETLDRQLIGLPPDERQEVLAEARAHLWALTEANQAMGQDPEAAAEQAVIRFGEAPTLGKDIRRESVSRRLQQGVTGKAAPVIGATLGMIGLATLTFLLQMPLLVDGRDATGVYLLLGALLGGTIALRRKRAAWAFSGAFAGVLLTPVALGGVETLCRGMEVWLTRFMVSGPVPWWVMLLSLLTAAHPATQEPIGMPVVTQELISPVVFAQVLALGALFWGRRRSGGRVFFVAVVVCTIVGYLMEMAWMRDAYWISSSMRGTLCLGTGLFWGRFALLLGLLLRGTRTIAQRLVDSFARLPQRFRPARIR